MITKTKTVQAIKVKADFLPFTVVQLFLTDLDQIEVEMTSKLKQAPTYFSNAPIIVDTSFLIQSQQLDIQKLCALLKQYKLIPIGIRGIHQSQRDEAMKNGLAVIGSGKLYQNKSVHFSSPTTSLKSTKIIDKPIRSGMQIYARETDLVILSSVNAGAECIADGNIHVYGPVRGRLLAGVNGNTKAHIFCSHLEAELIAIAGHYLVKEDMAEGKKNNTMIHVYLKNKKLLIEEI